MSEPTKFRAGWYPDARNTGYQRYWDGTAWTQHIAHLEGTASAKASGRGWKVGIGIALVALLSIGGVVAATRDDNATPAATHATPPANALDLARRAQVVAADLPSGWTECCPAEILEPAELRRHICGSPPSLPAHVAGYRRQYSLNLQPDDSEEGHLVSTALVSIDNETAETEFTALTAPAYQLCAVKQVEAEAELGASVVGRPSTTVTRGSLEGVQGVLDRYVTKYSTPTAGVTVYSAWFRVLVGRVLIRVNVQSYSAPTNGVTLTALAHALAVRARAGQPELPKS